MDITQAIAGVLVREFTAEIRATIKEANTPDDLRQMMAKQIGGNTEKTAFVEHKMYLLLNTKLRSILYDIPSGYSAVIEQMWTYSMEHIDTSTLTRFILAQLEITLA